MRRLSWLWPMMLLCATAGARNTDGVLDLIITPNNGVPAIIAPGESFEATLTRRADLRLAGMEGELLALEPDWTALPGGMHRAICTTPEMLATGTYALEAVADGRTDTNIRAVFVTRPMQDYPVIHLTDVHIGKANRDPAPETVFRNLVEHINGIHAAFVLITGDLTEQGRPEEFRTFLDVLDTCVLPTFVCAGNHDRRALNYEETFGPLVYSFRYGPDGYLVFDTKDIIIADPLDTQMGELQRLRRAIKPSRWSIGASHRYDPSMSMRSQLVLFVDDPLDYLLFGHWHRESQEKRVPWGTTPVVVTPAALDGAWRLILVAQTGIFPQSFQQISAGK
ncbi:MAG TPA: metallophosphoesterase [Candidatus Hydrogenedentes bacterium]|jgi:predicted phosphodiesterase|nr:metallophosphoesterase [Candidatus Hydrogenedentota bacterium]HPJ98842.1 metallophosphoesterase [Candidatus Hydrogenedentota bacterium]